ncbi:hypothetical protein QTP88_015850 [Uroleucon formosanum]
MIQAHLDSSDIIVDPHPLMKEIGSRINNIKTAINYDMGDCKWAVLEEFKIGNFQIVCMQILKVYESISGNDVTWRCTIKFCVARLIKNENLTVSSNLNHNHNTDEKKLNRQIIRSAGKKRAKDMTDRPIKIIRSEITKKNFDTLDYAEGNSPEGKWLQYCFGLPFLHPQEVSDCFLELMSEIPAEKKIQSFANYLVENIVSEDSLFPPELWAKGCNNLTQTTNVCESFHKHFNSYFFNAHPSIIKFVEVPIEFQTDIYLKINLAKTTIKQIKNKAVIKKHQVINELRDTSISTMNFIKNINNKVKVTQKI